jgi:hypothetical protein
MSHDPEIEELRAKTHCAAFLERATPLWRLDPVLVPVIVDEGIQEVAIANITIRIRTTV